MICPFNDSVSVVGFDLFKDCKTVAIILLFEFHNRLVSVVEIVAVIDCLVGTNQYLTIVSKCRDNYGLIICGTGL